MRAPLPAWTDSWAFWALASASFAALTAIFAKLGVERINSDFATFLRTLIIIAVLAAILAATRQFQPLTTISPRTYLFLALSGLATGASWLCYFRALKLGDAARVAPIDSLSCSFRCCLFGRAPLPGELVRRCLDRLWRSPRRLSGLMFPARNLHTDAQIHRSASASREKEAKPSREPGANSRVTRYCHNMLFA